MRKRILVVDDEATVRDVLQRGLGSDYAVITAGSGYEALAQVLRENQKFDLIITDLDMPGLSGVELVENLIEDVPIVIISGFLHAPLFQKAIERLHPAAVLEKPFGLMELRKILERVLGE